MQLDEVQRIAVRPIVRRAQKRKGKKKLKRNKWFEKQQEQSLCCGQCELMNDVAK